MSLFQPVVGIDPSGSLLAVVAVRTGLGAPALAAPPVVAPLRGERGTGLPEEAEGILSDFVARHGLAGCPARLYVPARHVYAAQVAFPPLKERDLRQALTLELERLFPVPASALRFGWKRLAAGSGDGRTRLAVAAARADYLERWQECVSRAGLSLAGAIPAGWALFEAVARIGAGRAAAGDLAAMVRDAGGLAECTIFSGGAPVFCAARACAPEAIPTQAIALADEALPDLPAAAEDGAAAVELLAPADWCRSAPIRGSGDPASWRTNGDFEAAARRALFGGDEGRDPWPLLGAFGAAAGERATNLLEPARVKVRFPWAGAVAGVLAAAAVVLAAAWPATVAWNARAELRRLDARIASLSPAVARVQDELGDMEEIEARTAVLREAGAGREEPVEILRVLTERLPTGTWVTGLRVENRKVEIDGLSTAASEIFPLLTRDGRFRAVEFASPITRQGDALERFQIRAEFVPASAASGGAR